MIQTRDSFCSSDWKGVFLLLRIPPALPHSVTITFTIMS